MHVDDDRLIFSATALSDFLACTHCTLLDRAWRRGGDGPPTFEDPAVEALRRRGQEHEEQYLARLHAEGVGDIAVIERPSEDLSYAERSRLRAAATLEAMRRGTEVIYQGELRDGDWTGRPDFLRRVDGPSGLGDWSYEVVDAKLAREAKAGAVLQLCVYSELLERVQGRAPAAMHLALGGPNARTEAFRLADYAAYYRSVRQRFEEHIAAAGETLPHGPDPVPHCEICRWYPRCDWERRDADHLALVAGITRRQRGALCARGITTVADLASLAVPIEPALEGVGSGTAVRIREQARIQVEGRTAGTPRYELLSPADEGTGLARLPEPSPGDLFFDIEGDPYAFDEGIEYLLGWVDAAGAYTRVWALNREQEKAAFERFIDQVMSRLDEHPDLHIYHYGHYEPTAVKKLMGRYGTREEEVDGLLRGRVFVDLHRVVRQALRASVESYSIKRMEPFYAFERAVELRRANHALAHFEAWLELGPDRGEAGELADTVEGYNRDDCLSTLRLRDWLEELRAELAEAIDGPVPRPDPAEREAGEELAKQQERVAELFEALTAKVPADEDERSPTEQGRWLLAQLLEWHRREQKSAWWEYYRCLDLDADERIEDRATLGGLSYVGVVDEVKKSLIHRYRYPPQDHAIKPNSQPVDPATGARAGTVVAVDDGHGTIDLKRGKSSGVPHPEALVPLDIVPDKALRESLIRLAESTLQHGLTDAHPNRAAVDLLLRRRPRVGQGERAALRLEDEETLPAAVRLVAALDRSVLPIQGPPGSGKTFTGARMIVSLLRAGKRVGITATSHKVIGNLLDETCRAASEQGFELRAIQKCDEDDACDSVRIPAVNDNAAVLEALNDGSAQLAGGTAWLWSREKMAGAVDVLFIDEAGQFSLANALAVCPAAESLVMLGDPRQLDQPQQGVHPPGADVSALDHLLGEQTTISKDRGLFLDLTWRLHPLISGFTSEIFYDSRLRSRPGLERQTVVGPDPLNGSGLRLVPLSHSGNQTESPEEVERVRDLVLAALESGATWRNAQGEENALSLSDILIVAPYNAQVSALTAALPDGARVGTVDKFQGQEAPIVIYSVTSSSADDAPRGMEFLYSGNRLNVATSRARCLTVVVASPTVFAPQCRTPRQMRLANAFCRYRELASS